jgi:hypothetical protein
MQNRADRHRSVLGDSDSTPTSGRRTELVIGGDNGISSTADLRTGFGKIRATFAVSARGAWRHGFAV